MKPKRDRKVRVIATRFRSKEHDWVNRMSKARGMSMSEFVRSLVLPTDYLFGLKKELTNS